MQRQSASKLAPQKPAEHLNRQRRHPLAQLRTFATKTAAAVILDQTVPLDNLLKESTRKQYKDILELTPPQKLTVYNHVRAAQIGLLDKLKTELQQPKHSQDKDAIAEILYGVLKLLDKNIQEESRMSSLLGFPKKSRLSDLIQHDLGKLTQKFPHLKTLGETSKPAIIALATTIGVEKTLTKLLNKKGFVDKIREYLSHAKQSIAKRPKL